MRYKLSLSTLSALLTISLFSIVEAPVQAAPGSLGQIPLFVAPPTPPNIFFMLDDSGSMHWSMPSDGVSSTALITRNQYDTIPDNTQEWNTWCLGANLMAYDPAITYKPWSANMPGTSTPFPDQTDLENVWADPYTMGVGTIAYTVGTENENINGGDSGSANLDSAPVVTWTDTDSDGQYDVGECPTSFADSRVKRADSLSASEQINFANWFSYYRLREHATKAVVTQVASTSSARMGMATLHHNNNVGVAIKDMSVASNKNTLLNEVVKVNSSGGTPLRQRLNWVGEYFDQSTNTPSSLNISTAAVDKPIVSVANGGECQQNFVMLMTDGQWNGGSSGVGAQDQTIDNNYVYPAHYDAASDTLADIAMKWYKTDLAPTMANKVPIQSGSNALNLDENKQQHLVTFGVAFGPTGTINSNPVDRTQAFSWPTPSANANTTVDDLRHAAYNGRGQFLSAKNPDQLNTALQAVISDIESRQGSGSAVSFNSTSLVSNTLLFFASFDTTNWTGDLRAFSIDDVTGDIAAAPTWNAAAGLDNLTNAQISNRVVYTWGTDTSGINNGVLFNWSTTDPQPASNILADLKQNQDGSTDGSPFLASQTRLNFVRGDTSNDGLGLIRSRASRLGDIISSAPRFVGSPESSWPDNPSFFGTSGNLYSSYQASTLATTRQGVVYVGSNDGLLHGFRTSDGAEVFSYLPSATASSLDNDGLHYLSELDYQHRYFVDGLPISSDVFMRIDPLGTRDWRTILVGALGGGGQGLYAIDVTDPSQFLNTQGAAEDAVLWEFTSQDDADLGYSFSVPQITMMNNNEWAVIVGNGYNAVGTDSAKLMIIYIEKGVDGQWTTGDYIKLDTGVGAAGNKNGLSTPTLIDLDNNGTTDRIYAGDLHGNMWAFDVSDSVSTNWKIAHEDALLNPVPLFNATHFAGSPPSQVSTVPQPITMKPLIAQVSWVNADPSNTPNLMVYFGTGQYVATGDPTNTDQQSFYAIWDTGAAVTADKLVEQTFLSGFPAGKRVLSQNGVNYQTPPTASGGQLGWFVNLPDVGERVVVDAFELEDLVFFNTVTPSSAPCDAGGSSFLMAVDMQTGGNPSIAAFDINGDEIHDTGDLISDGTNSYYASGVAFNFGIASATSVLTNSNQKSFGYISGTDSDDPHKITLPPPGGSPPGPGGTGVRRSWKQLFN